MTEEDKKLLTNFETKLRHFIYLHDELKRENSELKELLLQKEKELAKLDDKIEQLEANYANLKWARMISVRDKDIKDTKERISKLVREVDKCITLLGKTS
ncbi:MAG: hypothetical protein ACRC8J_09060 [Phocaeicola sp.]